MNTNDPIRDHHVALCRLLLWLDDEYEGRRPYDPVRTRAELRAQLYFLGLNTEAALQIARVRVDFDNKFREAKP